jgi:putative transposase
MTNHVHLLATGREPGGISRMMQAVGRRYARYVNRIHGRTGTLFEGRFKASLVDGERYLLTCMRYIELNPVRAGIVEDPAAYVWSSFRNNTGMEPHSWLVPRPEYLGLGNHPVGRATAYRALFRQAVAPVDLTAIRESARKSRALGGDEFLQRAEALLDRPIRVIPPGRPRKAREK